MKLALVTGRRVTAATIDGLVERKKKVNKHMRKLIPSAYYHIKQCGKYATNYCLHANIR